VPFLSGYFPSMFIRPMVGFVSWFALIRVDQVWWDCLYLWGASSCNMVSILFGYANLPARIRHLTQSHSIYLSLLARPYQPQFFRSQIALASPRVDRQQHPGCRKSLPEALPFILGFPSSSQSSLKTIPPAQHLHSRTLPRTILFAYLTDNIV
jgi:hypothetical protein